MENAQHLGPGTAYYIIVYVTGLKRTLEFMESDPCIFAVRKLRPREGK